MESWKSLIISSIDNVLTLPIDMATNINSMLRNNRTVRQRNLDLNKQLIVIKTKEELKRFE